MYVRVSIPELIEIRNDTHRVLVSLSQPLRVVELRELLPVPALLTKVTGLEECDFAKCYAYLYGGLVVSRGREVVRREVEGYIGLSGETECQGSSVIELISFIDRGLPEWCVKLGEVRLSFSKSKKEGYRWVDNIGIRVLVY